MNVVVNILDDVTTDSDQSVDSAEGDQSRLKLSHFLFEFQDLVYRGQWGNFELRLLLVNINSDV